jgi:3-methyladenine DNA glycosylase AlkD
MTASGLVELVRAALKGEADPVKAEPMRAYMKSAMPFLGVQAPLRRAVCGRVYAAHPLADERTWTKAALTLWRTARYREERYAAIHLTGHRLYKQYQTPRALPMYEEMITSGAWWDFVDEVAVQRVGPILRACPDEIRPLMLEWSACDDMWKRRSAIIAQLKFGAETDLKLLYRCIEPSLPSREFFLCKAIGWALREYAWTNPREVIRYVRAHRERLSALSQREALKNAGTTRVLDG